MFYKSIHAWSTIVDVCNKLSSQIIVSIINDYKLILICTLITVSLILWDISMSSIFNQQNM